MLQTRDVVVDGVRSPVLQGGPTDAEEAVVFVHGNPGFSQDWKNLSERVSEFSRTVAPDMPGFGDADKPEDFDYTIDGYARHLEGLLCKLGVRRAHLVLHDFGGAWGLAWAAAHLSALASLTLINIGVLPGYRWHFLARIWRTPVIGEIFMATTTRTGFRLLAKIGNPRGLPRSSVDQTFDHFDSGTRRAVLRLYRATDDIGAISERYGATLRSRACPTLVIWGRADPYIPVRYAERQREYFPQAKMVILDSSGHWPFIDNPDQVAAAVLPFLKSQIVAHGHL
jgi:pimeloyl-ACP methyl ester carboxylesterase